MQESQVKLSGPVELPFIKLEMRTDTFASSHMLPYNSLQTHPAHKSFPLLSDFDILAVVEGFCVL